MRIKGFSILYVEGRRHVRLEKYHSLEEAKNIFRRRLKYGVHLDRLRSVDGSPPSAMLLYDETGTRLVGEISTTGERGGVVYKRV